MEIHISIRNSDYEVVVVFILSVFLYLLQTPTVRRVLSVSINRRNNEFQNIPCPPQFSLYNLL